MGCVYKITNLVNNKCYIGYTTRTLEQRWEQHIASAFNPNVKDGSYDNYFKRAIRKYGIANFTTEQLFVSDDKALLQEQEKYWIEYYHSYAGWNNSNGYNLTTGGQGGNGYYKSIYAIDPISCNILQEYYSIAEAVKDYNTTVYNIINKPNEPLLCNHITFMLKEVVDALSFEELKDYIYSRYNVVCRLDLDGNIIDYFLSIKDAVEKTNVSNSLISFAITGIRPHGGYYQWAYYNERNSKVGNKIINTNGLKAVYKLDKQTLEIISRYDSIKNAAKENSCDESGIAKVCKGKRKSCGGYSWRYVE